MTTADDGRQTADGGRQTADGGRQAAGRWDGPVLVVEDLGQQRLLARRLVALVREAGLPAMLADLGRVGACQQGTRGLLDLAHRIGPRLIVFSVLFADRLAEILGLVTALRQAGVGSRLALAGPLPSLAAEELLAACPELDLVVGGEPEGMIVRLATNGGARSETGPSTSGCPSMFDVKAYPGCLDSQPSPVQDWPLPAYRNVGFVTVEASRGCYHRCSFCLPAAFYRAAGAAYRMRSVANVVDEMEALYRRGARLFLFDDEQFLPPPRVRAARVTAFGDELRRRGMTIAFTLKCRADDVEPALFEQLKDLGLVRAYIGVESGCQATLDVLAKGVTPQRNLEALATLDRLGIVADCRCLLFHPWSSLETVEEDIVFWRRAAPRVPGLFSFREVEIFPGTPLAERCRAEGRTSGPPWALAYALADPRAELLRRLGRVVFSTSATYEAAQGSVAQVWYATVLSERLQLAPTSAVAAHRLKAAVEHANATALATWFEMLAFVRGEDILDTRRVNEHAAEWAHRMGVECLELEGELRSTK